MGMEKISDDVGKSDPLPLVRSTGISRHGWVALALVVVALGCLVYMVRSRGRWVGSLVGGEAEQAALNTPGSAKALQSSYHDIIENVRPAVISIDAVTQSQNANVGEPLTNYARIGSGVIIDPRGYTLSSLHVVDGASSLKGTVYGPAGALEYTIKIVKSDRPSDLVLLRIDGGGPFPYAALGDSNSIRTGDVVLSIGSPFGFEQSVTSGIISSRNRTLNIGGMVYENMVQTDSPINKGSSGGPLIDAKGDIIAINTAIYSPDGAYSGISFAVPINRCLDLVAGIVDFLNERPPVATGQLAALSGTGKQIGNSYRLPDGQILTPPHNYRGTCGGCHPQVASGQLAALSGTGEQIGNSYRLPDGRVFTPPHNYRGTCIGCHPQLLQGLAPKKPAAAQPLNQVWGQPGYNLMCPGLGIAISEVDDVIANQNNMIQPGGVFVLSVSPGMPAAAAGLQRGDVIIRTDGRKIRDSNSFNQFLQTKTGHRLNLVILRFGVRRTVTVQMAQGGTAQAVPGTPIKQFAQFT